MKHSLPEALKEDEIRNQQRLIKRNIWHNWRTIKEELQLRNRLATVTIKISLVFNQFYSRTGVLYYICEISKWYPHNQNYCDETERSEGRTQGNHKQCPIIMIFLTVMLRSHVSICYLQILHRSGWGLSR